MWGMPVLGGRDAATAARLPAQVRGAPVREQLSLHSGAAAVAARRLREGEWLDDLSSARRRSIEKWTQMLSGRLEYFSLGRSLVESASSGSDVDILMNLKLIFSRRATSTINKRSSSLECFFQWCERNGKPSLPLRESDVFEYLKSGSGLRPTGGNALLSSLRFSGALLGLDGALGAITPRTTGAAYELLKGKRPTRRAVL
eukprot:5167025-Amphidinium_carterae.1